ncbi:B- and T-lymphocyte attenuator-like [Cyprinodon tularosa]|uniref:B- and T-lymphocyte attenuator-like n=1 Tax=Cyprinodon tularosa TaxID=77115 RepID=UPI0018E227A6|nr:B- and T-lymphocyte attenuator-like [Cyprinodon tularosa]
MISNSFKVLLIVLMSSALLVTLDAGGKDCTTELPVPQNTNYEAIIGQKLWIECPVVFCSNTPPTVYWYKIEEKHVRLAANNRSHIKIGWEQKKPLEGVLYLFFEKILRSHSGGYRCRSGSSLSHLIKITVIECGDEPQDVVWLYMYRVFGFGGVFITVISICVVSKTMLKGRCRKTADPIPQPSDEVTEDNLL